jgi:hypothetical protein
MKKATGFQDFFSNAQVVYRYTSGRRVRKKFGNKHFYGRVDGRRGAYFHVTYDDGDEEDLEEEELVPLLWADNVGDCDGGGSGGEEPQQTVAPAKRGPGCPSKAAAAAAAAAGPASPAAVAAASPAAVAAAVAPDAAARWEVTWTKNTEVGPAQVDSVYPKLKNRRLVSTP